MMSSPKSETNLAKTAFTNFNLGILSNWWEDIWTLNLSECSLIFKGDFSNQGFWDFGTTNIQSETIGAHWQKNVQAKKGNNSRVETGLGPARNRPAGRAFFANF